jgi:hypothetical protein
MQKTTIYLPSELKLWIERLAREQHRPQAELIRDALEEYALAHARPRPRLGVVASGQPELAERVDELLAGFGEDD